MDQLAAEYPLAGKLTIYDVGESKAQFLDWLDHSGERLEINLAGIEEIDSAGVQLLALLKRESLRQNKVLALCKHSSATQVIFSRMGVIDFFGDPIETRQEAQ